MITYNHESYIEQAIESVLMQKCNFRIELLIGEDWSTDNTKLICQKYAENFPQVHLLKSEANLGVMPNFIRTLQSCTGKYIALCEGDDYWTDPHKLQKQVDLLNSDSTISFCFHNALTHYVDTDKTEDFNISLKEGYFSTIHLLCKEWFVPTASILIRRGCMPKEFPNWFIKVYSGDYALELLLSLKGKFYYLDDKMSIYRKNAINSLSANQINPYNHLIKRIFLLKNFAKSQNSKIKIVVVYAIVIARLKIFRAKMYSRLPITSTIKDKFIRTFQFQSIKNILILCIYVLLYINMYG